jgi:hypothetical protein
LQCKTTELPAAQLFYTAFQRAATDYQRNMKHVAAHTAMNFDDRTMPNLFNGQILFTTPHFFNTPNIIFFVPTIIVETISCL